MRLTVHYGKDGELQQSFKVGSSDDVQIIEGTLELNWPLSDKVVVFKEWVYFTLDT